MTHLIVIIDRKPARHNRAGSWPYYGGRMFYLMIGLLYSVQVLIYVAFAALYIAHWAERL